ncbi:BASIC PROLINE-RICH PROTEIN6 [Hibiscus trionum]|nr:BASIC PROLINE-RICH PROTEIN6 [Hibiscus trionum]
MNRNLRESLVSGGGRSGVNINNHVSAAASHQHRRGRSLNAGLFPRDSDENLDLFSKSRRSLSAASSDESTDVSVKLGRISNGSAIVKGGIDDLLSSTEGGKHDYDWLLTPPGTPLFPSSEGSESQSTSLAPRSNPKVRSVSTTKASRLSVSHSESNHSSRSARSSSVTRPSLSSSYNNYSSNRGGSILNTSSASVSSYTRPSSPITRSLSTARPSTPSARSTSSRPSTPSKVRPSPPSSYADKSRPSQSSRPSTPTSRPQIPANLSSTSVRSNSRPSTPTRRNPATSISSPASPSLSTARIVSNGRTAAPSSRPSSPSPRVRPPQQPVVPLDFPLDTPPNLRTTLPDRPVSAGRSRPGASATVKANQDTSSSINMPRRHSSPIAPRGRLTDPPGRTRIHSNGHSSDIHETRRISNVSDLAMRKPVKSSTTTADGQGGFGRTISKKSLDMAIRHMDIRNGSGNIRSLSGTTLFPQSIRSAPAKTQSLRSLSTSDSFNSSGSASSLKNGDYSENGNGIMRPADNGSNSHDGRYSAKISDADIYESSRYDALLLKEDLKNTNWLHSIDDKSDQGSIFDNGFESLPEPFGLL